jgi:homoserine dehydrogenase
MGDEMLRQRIIICGFGKVGRAFATLVQERQDLLRRKYKLDLAVVAVVDIGGAALAPRGLEAMPLAELLEHVVAGGTVEQFGAYGMPGAAGSTVIESLPADLLAEATPTNLTTGEPGLSHMRTALTQGLHVVAANKGPLVLHYAALRQLAETHGVQICMSAATAAALPSLDVGQVCLAGAHLLGIEGILNGTTNFMLTKMQHEGYSYTDALQEAQARGIAETDPTLDVEGYDTANKLILLSNTLLGTVYGPGDVARRGITDGTAQMVTDARRSGKILKLIGRATVIREHVHLSVAPEELSLDHPLASVPGAEKAVTYATDTMGRITVMGGQSSPTGAAAAMLKDIINLGRARPDPE